MKLKKRPWLEGLFNYNFFNLIYALTTTVPIMEGWIAQ